eukprot:TRINITY_DN25880_c0_g1_i1.p1 TRINITY_DN25880_c0_g1~~TRINITY_DN25880_c0_g1_i1.p1  ORF type:complete len:309 (-),score=44.53 TRINITY_DN25880_c0_g1_i1:316-1242(-)
MVYLEDIEYLGYKETGKVVKTLHRMLQQKKLKLTHVDNRGSKSRRLVVSSLRCRKPMTVAISELCPEVHNIKLRVSDDDVGALVCLDKVDSVELVYHVGQITSPGEGTLYFLQSRGSCLSSLTLICQNLTLSMVINIAENCPNLNQLWLRCNHFQNQATTYLPSQHNFLTRLSVMYLRIGDGERYIDRSLSLSVLVFLLKNAPLKELLLAVRSAIINDSNMIQLFNQCPLLQGLEKLMIVVPGVNSMQGILELTECFVNFVNVNCPRIQKLGNLLSWRLDKIFVDELLQAVQECNWDLNIINKKMTMR